MAAREPPRHGHGATRLSCPTPATTTTTTSNLCSFLNRAVSAWLVCAVLSLFLFNLLWFYPVDAPWNVVISGEGKRPSMAMAGGGGEEARCDYSEGRWVAAPGRARRYNGTACNVKESERVEVLDVTKLATMRPDGHPGVYMHRDPFARGVPKRLQVDCLHFCLPGPVDTFNEILLQLLISKRRDIFTSLIYVALCLALLYLLCLTPRGSPENAVSALLRHVTIASSGEGRGGGGGGGGGCDYSEGRWVAAAGHARRYNGTACDHVAFVGDSMARNQAESLVCLLATAFPYTLVYRDPHPRERKFWRWAFPAHNVTVSVYWAPFLARSTGKTDDYRKPRNDVYLGALAERWSADADTMDVVVISQGHWFWIPTVYHDAATGEVVGMHNVTGLKNTGDIGLFAPYRRTLRMALERLVGSGAGNRTRARTVVVATFSPSHFEKAWDDPTTCARTRPYDDGEKEVGADERELRSIAMEEGGGARRDEAGDDAAGRAPGGVHAPRPVRARRAGAAAERLPPLLLARAGGHMGAYQPLQHHHGGAAAGYFLPRTAVTWLAAACLSLALLHLLCCSPPGGHQAVFSPLLQYFNGNGTYSSNISSSGVEERSSSAASCDYSVGRWVRAPGHARRYNGTACNVKPEQDCVGNGRPETGYLDWRWQPASCELPAFDAAAFLAAARGRHVAFVGDSMARNQAESLHCLLAAAFPHELVAQDAERYKRQFTRWSFPSHGVTLSTYWAPFLVRSGGKPFNYTMPYNLVYLDELGNRWDADAGTMDVVVLTAGHWFWNPAVYHRRGEVVGVHAHPELNATEIGFTSPYREAFRRALERLGSDGRRRTVVLGTFAPPHFDGKPIFDPTACTRTEPYRDGEKEVGSIEREMRSIVFEEAAAAAAAAATMRVEVEDVTRLATMRPDGHPGVYMHRDPFAGGGARPERMQTDCLHSCLPGPVDTFNEILLQILSRQRHFIILHFCLLLQE
uniref:Uncharacterized protein n=1 Tax=Oryza barthii TaxID=65489 RepID=A0A0D3GEL8_9ORYZ